MGFFLASHMYCSTESDRCVMYHSDGLLHNVFAFEILIATSAVLAILGYLIAKWMYRKELEQSQSHDNTRQFIVNHTENTVI